MQTYINAADQAIAAVAEIVALVKSGTVEPLIGFDTETAPQRAYVGYPGTTFDDDGERLKPTKAAYLLFAQAKFAAHFNPAKLAVLGLFIPKKAGGSGNEAVGLAVGAAWAQFWAALQTVDNAALDAARWQDADADVAAFYTDLTAERAEIAATVAALTGVRGKKAAVESLTKQLAYSDWQLAQRPAAEAALEAPLPTAVLRHLVGVGVENRVKVEPIQPGLDPYTSDVFLVQFSLRRRDNGEILSWIFNTFDVPLALLKPALGLNATYIGANIKFDLKLLLHNVGTAPRNVWCTRVASRMLNLGLQMSHSLAACAERYCGLTMGKEVRNTFIGQRHAVVTPAQLAYGYFDTEVLFPIYDAQRKLAEGRGQLALVQSFSKLSWITAKWELTGLRLDAERWMTLAAEVVKKRDEVARELETLLLPADYVKVALGGAAVEAACDEDDEDADTRPDALIRLSQTALVAGRLEGLLNLEIPDDWRGKNGAVSLGKFAREALDGLYTAKYGKPHPFFALYKRWAKLQKQSTTYGRSFLWAAHPLTGAVHPSYSIAGTDTGRYSSSSPNALNIPTQKAADDADFRSAFIAPKGFLYGNADYAAAEQRIAADLSGDETLTALFNEDGDSHSVSAALMFHLDRKPIAEPISFRGVPAAGGITQEVARVSVPSSWSVAELMRYIVKEPSVAAANGELLPLTEVILADYKKTTRQRAKIVGLGVMFGMTKWGIAKQMQIDPDVAGVLLDELFSGAYPQMMAYFERTGNAPFCNAEWRDDGYQYGYATAYNGLRRWFRLPVNPSRRDHPQGLVGQLAFEEAQRDYRRRCNKIRREAKNVGTQGGNAVWMCEALLRLCQLGRGLGIEPALAIYDELLVLVPEATDPKVANTLIEQAMVEASEQFMHSIPSKAEANPLSPYWAKF